MSFSVLIIQGSESDSSTTRYIAETLGVLGVSYDVYIVSAHRTPDRLEEIVGTAAASGYKIVIACAGGSAHLPGMAASHTLLPVLGVAAQSSTSARNEQAALDSMTFMPAGVPLATMGVGKAGAVNAALMAVRLLAVTDPVLRAKLEAFVSKQTAEVPKTPTTFPEGAPTTFSGEV